MILIVNTHSSDIYSECVKREIDLEKIVDIYNKKIGIINSEKYDLDFSGCDCKEGWITWKELLSCTDNATVFRHIVQNDTFSKWWDNCDNNVILKCSSQLENRMSKIVDEIIPELKKEDMIFDIGCSNGMMDEKISPYCGYIDAYDYSEASINEAKKRANNKGINNISCEVADAKKMVISKKYDLVFLLGLTVCFEKDEDVLTIINKI